MATVTVSPLAEHIVHAREDIGTLFLPRYSGYEWRFCPKVLRGDRKSTFFPKKDPRGRGGVILLRKILKHAFLHGFNGVLRHLLKKGGPMMVVTGRFTGPLDRIA